MAVLTLLQCVFRVLSSYPVISDSITVWLILSPSCSVVLLVAHMSCINLERAFTNTLFHWLCIWCIGIEDNLILAIPHLTFITGMCIYTLQFRSSFPALWGISCSLEWATSSSLWAQSESRLRSAGLCPHQSHLLVQAPFAGVWSDGAANVTVHQRNLKWLGEIWGLTWHTLHGSVRKIPSCLENIVLTNSDTCMALSLSWLSRMQL